MPTKPPFPTCIYMMYKDFISDYILSMFVQISYLTRFYVCKVLHPHDTYFTIIIFIQAGPLGFFNYKNLSIHYHSFPSTYRDDPQSNVHALSGSSHRLVHTCILFGLYMVYVCAHI